MSDTQRQSVKRTEALNRYKNLVDTYNQLMAQIENLNMQIVNKTETATIHKGGALILKDMFQFTSEELLPMAQPILKEQPEKAEEPKYDEDKQPEQTLVATPEAEPTSDGTKAEQPQEDKETKTA